MLKPTTDILISFEALYMSPKGQNYYSSKKIYKLTDLEYLIKKIDEKNASEDQQKKERSKLSPSLRFEILKRDNYKCKLCGASQEDGAKLHVDHIIPIAKGGKTEPANLQTLCERCNLGKGIKDL
ncbi:MAG: HNH endonuclease [Clostridia bacterium]|nr:HNH endonuclease [Clostridia bacterium]